MTRSELDNIKGIGQILKNRLIKKYKSIKENKVCDYRRINDC